MLAAFATDWTLGSRDGARARAQSPIRMPRWSYECERVLARERTLGEPVFRDDTSLSRILRERDDAGWELVAAAEARDGRPLLCFRRPR